MCATIISLALMINAAPCNRLIFGGHVIALGLTWESLSTVKKGLMKLTQRPSVRLVAETGMFL